MANRTDKEANAIHGKDPQNLIDYIVRQKVYDTLYWKEHCFGLNPETLIEKAIALDHVGKFQTPPPPPQHFSILTNSRHKFPSPLFTHA